MEPVELKNERLRLVIDPHHGCRINALDIKRSSDESEWTPVLRTWNGQPDSEGSFLMLPWTNRIKDAKFVFKGKEHQLNANHSDQTAIHGIGRDHGWSILDRSPYSGRFGFDSRLIENPNCPFAFGAVLRVELFEDSVDIELDLTNLDDRSMPAGVGHHPYFMRTLFDADDTFSIKAHVDDRYQCQDQIPTGATIDDDACALFRNGEPIGNPDLDDVFNGFDGHAQMSWDKSGVQCDMRCSEAFGHLVVYTPRDGDDESSPPLPWVCVEPVTMVNDGFNLHEAGQTGTGVRVLGSKETMRTSMKLNFTTRL